jgi:hypothetical protein
MDTVQQQQQLEEQKKVEELDTECTQMELDKSSEEEFSQFEMESINPNDKKYILLCKKFRAVVPYYFIESCDVFKNMFEVTYSDEDNNIFPITDDFSIQEFKNYYNIYHDIYKLKVKNNEDEEMSYLDYMTNHTDEFIERYTNKNEEPPPHCIELTKMYEKYEDDIIKMFAIDEYFQNPYFIKGITLCITCFIKSADKKIDTETKESHISRQNKVKEIATAMVDCYEDKFIY